MQGEYMNTKELEYAIISIPEPILHPDMQCHRVQLL